MTDEQKKPTLERRALYETLPERYRILDSGAVYDIEAGRIIDNLGGPFTITKENALEMRQKGKDAVMLAQLRGLAASRGHPLPDDVTLEDILHGASSAVEALTTHMAATFLNSKNLRGMGETYGRLVNPLTGEAERGGAAVMIINNNNMNVEGARTMERIFRDVAKVKNGEVIDGSARDVQEGE